MLALARRDLTVIRQNILLSVAINLLAVVLAGVGIVSPILGAIIHEASAVLLVVNAVRIIEWDPPQSDEPGDARRSTVGGRVTARGRVPFLRGQAGSLWAQRS